MAVIGELLTESIVKWEKKWCDDLRVSRPKFIRLVQALGSHQLRTKGRLWSCCYHIAPVVQLGQHLLVWLQNDVKHKKKERDNQQKKKKGSQPCLVSPTN